MRDLESRDELTSRQIFVIAVSALAQMIDFLDFFLISFVIAMVAAPWRLIFNQSTIILLSSGIGAVIGSFVCGAAADRWGRRPVLLTTIVIFGLGTVALAFTPEGSWIYVAMARFFVGFATTGIYSANIPLLQEFMPAKRRGLLSGVVATFIPVGMLIGATLVALLGASIGWRGLFTMGAVPVLPLLFAAAFIPESPVWLAENGQDQASRRSIAWALKLPLDKIAPTSAAHLRNRAKPSLLELLQYPRSLVVSWVGFLGAQTGIYGLSLMGAGASRPARRRNANSGGLSDDLRQSWRHRRAPVLLMGLRASWPAKNRDMPGFSRSRSDDRRRAHRACVDRRRFGFLAIVDRDLFRRQREFCRDGALCGRNLAAHLRASGLGSAYGVGSLGKIIGPLGLGLFLGSSNVISPAASLDAILPGLTYLAMWLLATGLVFLTLAIETKGKTIDEIARELTKPKGLGAPALGLAKHER